MIQRQLPSTYRVKSFKPVSDYVLVKPGPKPGKTEGGVILPDKAAPSAPTGVVMAVGQGTRLLQGGYEPACVNVGDEIWFNAPVCFEVEVDGVFMLIIKENDIMGVVEKADTRERRTLESIGAV